MTNLHHAALAANTNTRVYNRTFAIRSRFALAMGALLAISHISPVLTAEESAEIPPIIVAQTSTTTTPVTTAQIGQGAVEGRVYSDVMQRYLNNARVTVIGTQRETFTDEYGSFRLSGLPAGEVTISVLFSGLAQQTERVIVVPNGTVTQDFNLASTTTAAAAVVTTTGTNEVVVLEKYSVQTGRSSNNELATNEQRFAPNIKDVVESTAFGDVAEGNVGEFLKYMPGVTVDYVAADVRTVSVRGFGAGFTSVSNDGAPMASAASGASIRAFEFEQASINNVARIEVTKVPTPSQRADSLGGSVNMIPKNAFERKGWQLNYSLYGNFNSEDVDVFSKTPGPMEKETYKVLPGFTADLTLPITKNFGIVVTGLSSNQFNEQHRSLMAWNFAQAGATQTNPYLQTYTLQDGPKNTFRDSFGIRADWRIAQRHTLSFGYQLNYYASAFGNRNLNWGVGTNAAPTTAGGPVLTWGPDFANSALGRGTVTYGSSFRDKNGATNAGNIKYRFKGDDWEVEAMGSTSISKSWYRDTSNGHFSGVNTTLVGISRVSFADYEEPRPEQIHAYNAAGVELNPYNVANHRLTTTRTQPLDAKDTFNNAQVSVRKDLNLPFYLSIKAGVDLRNEKRDIRRIQDDSTFVGADGVANTADDNAAPYLDTRYGPYSYYGFDDIQWVDPYLVYGATVAHPNYLVPTAAQALANARYRFRNSLLLKETITATYLQLDAKFFDNRLSITTGVRYEGTDDKGQGALAPNVGSNAAQVYATWTERGYSTDKSYDGFYPSFLANLNITDNLILRFAVARTLGRPDLDQILPNTQVNDQLVTTDNIPPQTIIYTNPALNPYQAINYDLSLEYYFSHGGLASAGVFHKDIDGFFQDKFGVADQATLDDLGLGDETQYLGFATQTKVNSAQKTKINGIELNLRLPLSFIPVVGKNLQVFANGTKLDLDGPRQNFATFISKSANWGVTFTNSFLTLRANWNYRGRQYTAEQTAAAYGGTTTGFAEYYRPRTTLDVNAEVKLARYFVFFANARNITNVAQILERYNDVTPDYARFYRNESYGVQVTVGVKGAF